MRTSDFIARRQGRFLDYVIYHEGEYVGLGAGSFGATGCQLAL